jgi:mRNA interferase MazF
MRRGDIVTVAAPGDYGKPRPAVVVQTDLLNDTHRSIVVCLVTSTVLDAPLFRVTVEHSPQNGLERQSQIMVDKLVSVRREKIGRRLGSLDDDTLLRLGRSLAFVLGMGA